MLENVKEKISSLVALYEGQRQRAAELSRRLEIAERELADSRAKVAELGRVVDNLKLQGIFAADGNSMLAKTRLDKMIRDIDKCIAALEK